jgi:hypothetical protein
MTISVYLPDAPLIVIGLRLNTVQEHFREAGVMRGDGLWA